MEPITIYLILSLIVNILLFLLLRRQKELEQLHEQIIKSQARQIKLLERIDELKNQKNPNLRTKKYPSECQLEITQDITCP